MPLKAFMTLIFQHCPGLAPFAPQRDDILAQFTAFKQSVPVMGAILLEPRLEKVLLVRGFQAAASWGFPRGKVSKDETDAECAVREARAAQGCVSQGGRPATRRLVLAVCSNARLCGQRRVRAPHFIARPAWLRASCPGPSPLCVLRPAHTCCCVGACCVPGRASLLLQARAGPIA